MNTLQTMQKKLKNKKGFTLMEMLIVVAIIAILVAIAIPSFNSALNKARKATDDANIRSVYAEHIYYQAIKDETPTETPDVDGTTIQFADGDTYELQYYKSVTKPASGAWKGSTENAGG